MDIENIPIIRDIFGSKEEDKRVKYDEMMSKDLMTGHDILNFPSEPNDYLVENFLWKGSISMVIGAEKVCKSIFTSHKAMAMTSGDAFLDCFDVSKPLKVLYVQAEGEMGETKDRFLSATKKGGVTWNPDNWRHYYPPALCLDIDGVLDEHGQYPSGTYNDFVERIRRSGFKPDAIFIDPLYMAMKGKISDEGAVRDFWRNIRRLKEEFSCAIVVIHHERRPKLDQFNRKIEEGDNSIFGSSMLKNFASHVLRISIVDNKGKPMSAEKEESNTIKYRKVACTTSRSGNVTKKLLLRLIEDPLKFEIVDGESNTVSQESVLRCIKSNQPIHALNIHKITGIASEQSVRNAMQKLKNRGLIYMSSKEGKYAFYSTTPNEKE